MATLVIDNAPDEVVERLRRRAARHRTTVSVEVIEMIGGILTGDDDSDEPITTPAEMYAAALARGFSSPDEWVAMIREDRDRADGRH